MTKIVFSGLVLLTAAVGMGGMMGCSSSEQSTRTVSADDALTTFQNPTGSFNKDNASQAFSGFRSEQSESGKVSTNGAAGGGSTKTQSLKLLSRTLDAKASCAEGQTCACATSGSFVYTAEQSKAGAAAHIQFDKCVSEDGSGFTGEAVLVVTTNPILGVEADGPVAAGDDKNLLLAARGEAFDATQSIKLEFALLHEAGYTLLAIQVPDGKIVIGVAPSGNAFVKAKQGTWVCKAGKGKKGYACASVSGGGEEVDVEDADASPTTSSTPSSEEEAAPPTGGKSSSSDGIGLDEADDSDDRP
jgi:hypothetical protein